MRRRTLAILAAGAAAWEIQRRRDRRAIAADPAWWQLRLPLEGESREVHSADGTRLHLELFGPEDAPLVLLLHGWTEAITVWRLQIADLAADHRVVAYDLRGHGRSGPVQSAGATMDGLVADLDAVLDAVVPAGRRAVVAGHSMGGMTVLGWAERYPERVRDRLAGVALVNSAAIEMTERNLILGPRRTGAFRALVQPV